MILTYLGYGFIEMRKMAERRDTRNCLLGKCEYQKSDGGYMYKYVYSKGNKNSCLAYSWVLTQTDRLLKDKYQISEKIGKRDNKRCTGRNRHL